MDRILALRHAVSCNAPNDIQAVLLVQIESPPKPNQVNKLSFVHKRNWFFQITKLTRTELNKKIYYCNIPIKQENAHF